MTIDAIEPSEREKVLATEIAQLRHRLADVDERFVNRTRGEDRLRIILDSAIDCAIIVMDLDGRVTLWNEGAHRILGWTEEEMVGQAFSIFSTQEDRDNGVPRMEMQAALHNGRANDERWLQKKDGSCFWASGEMMPLHGESDAVQGFIKILRDGTEQGRAVESQRADAEFLRGVLASSADCIKVLDLDANLVFMSEGGQRVMEVSDFNSIRGCPWPEFWKEQGNVDARAAVESAKAGGIGHFQGLSNTLAGTPKWWDVQVTPIRGANGLPEKLLSVSRDITLIRRAEAALRESNEMLEQRIAAAAAEREKIEQALRQSQKMEAVGQLTGGIAHDFNNLLTSISGSLELLQVRMTQGRLSDVDRYLTAAQGAAKRAASLTHRLLAFSRRQTLDPRPTNINRLVADMEELIRRSVGPQVEVEVIGASGLWPSLVDAHQVESVLLNLCINARDAMPDGGRLTIETANKWLDERAARECELPPGQYLSLCVTDTGAGMAPEVIKRAFDPFFTTKPMGSGTGLGLSMVYGFARQSGGQVRIYSELGHGTTMYLYLPRYIGDAERIDDVTHPAEASCAHQGEIVLVVEDEPAIRMLVTDVVEDLGYAAIEALDGATGLEMLQSNSRIDLLITDIGLPGGMNGRQVADAGRILRPGLKVLFITGYAENAVIGNGRLEPGMRVLTKPFAMEELAQRISHMITEN